MTVKDISGTATPVVNKVTTLAQRIARLKNAVEQGTLSYQVRQDIVALIENYELPKAPDLDMDKLMRDADEAIADQKRLIEFFRDNPGWGAYGDVRNMTPGQCAVHFLQEYADKLPTLEAELEMTKRRAVVGEEPYHSPSVDPSEFKRHSLPDGSELVGVAKYLTDNEVWLELAKVSLRLGNSATVASDVASEMLSAYRQAFARPGGA